MSTYDESGSFGAVQAIQDIQQATYPLNPVKQRSLSAEMSDDRCISDAADLADILSKLAVRSIFVVADAQAYQLSGAKTWLSPVLRDYQIAHFDKFEPNPKLEDVLIGLQAFRDSKADLVIAVGGGTAIDIAKLIVAFGNERSSPESLIEQRNSFSEEAVPLIAIPTTAGTGSEATQFAVVYRNGCKYSVDHPKLMPAYCVLLPELSLKLPASVTAQTGLDAFCQALESIWSVRANQTSVRYAAEAVRLVFQNLPTAVHAPDRTSREAMLRAAHLAGRAINQTRTTASHAISYALTSDFGIPHGHAVALTLGAMLLHNAGVQDDDCNDPRGVDHVRKSIQHILELLDGSTPEAGNRTIRKFMESIGCETRLGEIGISGEETFRAIAGKVNLERLRNNPRQLTSDQLVRMLQELQ